MEMDTIAAISTPIGEGGIAIIRISGDDAISIANKLYKGKSTLDSVKSHTINYGYITDAYNNVIDEVLVTIMKAPKTFTMEDVVEINCHGGFVIANKMLNVVIENGARLAEPGEFSKRAFLNGRIDLSQAEAVIDLIRAKTDRASEVALKQIEGKLSGKINDIRKTIIEVLAFIEVNIDYPEHDIDEITYDYLLKNISAVKFEINLLLNQAKEGKIYRDGISIAIIGRPNVGKSSLLNTLISEAKAIVTDIPGTTRDIVEEYINIKGIPIKLIDTAGIRETDNIVEKLGVEKAKEVLNEADLILLVFNNNDELIAEDLELINIVKENKVIIVINKTDLPKKINEELLREMITDIKLVNTSLINEEGIEKLKFIIHEFLMEGNLNSDDLTYVSNSRHIELLRKTKNNIDDSINAIQNLIPIDIISIDISNAYQLLGEIIGESIEDDLVDQIFSDFCVGK